MDLFPEEPDDPSVRDIGDELEVPEADRLAVDPGDLVDVATDGGDDTAALAAVYADPTRPAP